MAKVIMADFYKIDFMKGIILVKVDQMYDFLKSANHCYLIKALAGVCPWMSIRLLRHSFIKELAQIVRDTAVQKEFVIAK